MRGTAGERPTAYFGVVLWCLVVAAFGGGGLYALGTGIDQAWDHHQAMSASGITGVLAPMNCGSSAPQANGDPGQTSTGCSGLFEAPGVGRHLVRIADERPDDDWVRMPQMRSSSPDSGLVWAHPFSWFTTLAGLAFRIAAVVIAGLLIPRVLRRVRVVTGSAGPRPPRSLSAQIVG